MRPALCLILMSLLYLGCSKDRTGPDFEGVQVPDFTIIGEDASHVYQYNYKAGPGSGVLTNLSEENDVDRNYITLRQVDDVLTFYSFSSGNFSAVQRNVSTGEVVAVDNYYSLSGEQAIIWGANSENKFFMGYYSPQGTTNFGVRIIDPVVGETLDLALEFNVKNVYQPLYFENKLLVPYLDGRANHRVAVLNTITNTVLETLDFGSDTPSFLINDTGDMAVITGDNGVEYGYAEYDLVTLQKKSEENFSLSRFFSPGPLNADLIDGVLYYLNFYAQPALVPFGPAVYDFRKMENNVIDMIAIVQEVQNELQTNITLTSLEYEENGGVFIVGYSKKESTVQEGGVLIISADGDLRRNITLPFAPTYIVQ